MIKKFLVWFLLIPNLTLGASSDFLVEYKPYDDVTPPTTPTLLSAIPVTHTQINLAWSASMDDMGSISYKVLRDGNPVIDTTQLGFSDSGLLASTTYTYEVYAYDDSGNISTTSNAISTTTLVLPPLPPISEGDGSEKKSGGSGGILPLELVDLQISSNKTEINFKWETNRLSRFVLRWGETVEFFDGFIEGDIYKEKQETVIYNLKPNTEYFFELVGIDSVGKAVVLKVGNEKTKAEEKKIPVQNVLRFSAEVQNQTEVFLSWQLPLIPDLEGVRIVKNSYFWPTTIDDGEVIYEGLKTNFLDKEGLKNSNSQYYTIFVLTSAGEWSSGAVVTIRKKGEENNLEVDNKKAEEIEKNDGRGGGEDEVDEDNEKDDLSGLKLNFEDIKITQDGEEFSFLSDRILLSYKESFLISIKKDALPPHLKIIIATLVDPTNHNFSYSFILKLNEEKTAYEAVLAPLQTLGISSLQIEVIDLENKTSGRYKKQLDFVVGENKIPVEESAVFFPDKVFSSVFLPIVSIFLFITLIIFFLIFIKRRREREEIE